MTIFSVLEAKTHFSEILAKAESGQEVLIARRGTTVARLSGVERARRPLNLAAIDAFRASLTPTKERSAELIRRMRDAAY
jgi:prevent-host-death family protein